MMELDLIEVMLEFINIVIIMVGHKLVLILMVKQTMMNQEFQYH